MSQRQRRRRDQRRKQAQPRGPSKRQLAAGTTIAMGATLAATGSAQAADFTVTNLNDAGAGSLRQAVEDADNNPGPDRVLFQSGLSGSINLTTGQLLINDSVQIQGPGSGTLTVHNTGVGRVAYFYPGTSSTVSGLNLIGADGNDVTNGGVFYVGGFGPPSSLTISNSVLSGSHAISNGGAIQLYYGSLNIQSSTISGNSAGDNGGAIYFAYGGSLQVDSSTISGNTADNAGGGVYFNDTDAASAIRNSTISGNTVTSAGGSFDDGGALYLDNDNTLSSILLQNSTLSGNSVPDQGGAIYDFSNDGDPSALTIESSTIAGNSAGAYGGGVYQYYGETIRNTIIADNTAQDGSDLAGPTNQPPSGGIPANLTFSLVEHLGPTTTINQTGPNILGQDPQLGGLASNGGPTQTRALSATSPATDKGNSFGAGSDQRGVLRPIDFPGIANAAGGNGSDIGAFELQPSNAFTLGKLKRNKKKGTAKQIVKLPLPDAGTVTIKGKGLKTKTRQVTGAKKIKLPVIPKGKKKAQENSTGKVKLKAKITYNATGNAAKTLKKKLKLLKR